MVWLDGNWIPPMVIWDLHPTMVMDGTMDLMRWPTGQPRNNAFRRSLRRIFEKNNGWNSAYFLGVNNWLFKVRFFSERATFSFLAGDGWTVQTVPSSNIWRCIEMTNKSMGKPSITCIKEEPVFADQALKDILEKVVDSGVVATWCHDWQHHCLHLSPWRIPLLMGFFMFLWD